MSAIIIPVIIFLFASAFYVHHRLVPSSWSRWTRILALFVLIALALSLPAQFYLRFAMRNKGLEGIFTVINYNIGLYSLLLTFTIVRDIVWLLFKVSPFKKVVSAERRQFMRQTSHLGVLGATTALFGTASLRALADPTVVRVQIPVKNLPAELEGFTIVQISDVHVGQLQGETAYLQKIIAAVNALNADVLAVTGDIVDGSVARLSERVAPLAGLKSKFGAYFVTGNHEYYSGATSWIKHFQSFGWHVLQNEHRVLNIANHSIIIAGVHDLKSNNIMPTHECNPTQALANAPTNAAFTLLLAHHPGTAERTDNLKIDLQISGHTHAGQYFPATWLIQWVHKYYRGLNQHDNGLVYVNSGTGYWGPPLRTTDITGEITHFTLVRQA